MVIIKMREKGKGKGERGKEKGKMVIIKNKKIE